MARLPSGLRQTLAQELPVLLSFAGTLSLQMTWQFIDDELAVFSFARAVS